MCFTHCVMPLVSLIMMHGKQLPERDLQLLRDRQLLNESETAFKEGDVVIAEDLITKTRRIINITGLVLEANKQILHD